LGYQNVFERIKRQPCVDIFKLRLTEVREGYAKVETDLIEEYCNEIPVIWGALFSALSDAAGSAAIMTLIGDDFTPPTEELHVIYKNAAVTEDEGLFCEAVAYKELVEIKKEMPRIKIMKAEGAIKSKRTGETKATFELYARIVPLKIAKRIIKKKKKDTKRVTL